MIALTFLLAGVSGAFGALLGLGGGIFIIPISTLILGADMHAAMGASLVSVIATSTGAATGYVREHLVNVRLGSLLELTTTAGALVGALMATYVSPHLLHWLFAGLLVYSAASMFRQRHQDVPQGVPADPVGTQLRLHQHYYDHALGRTVAYNVAHVYGGLAVMGIAGITSGLLGIGSGLLKVLGMDRLMRLPIKVSSATSNFTIGATAAASAGYYFARGFVDPQLAAPVALGVFVGAKLGTRLLTHMRSATLRSLFVPVLLYTALQMFLRK